MDCKFKSETPCGIQIASLQKSYLMTLGLLIVGVAAAEVFSGVTNDNGNALNSSSCLPFQTFWQGCTPSERPTLQQWRRPGMKGAIPELRRESLESPAFRSINSTCMHVTSSLW
jgi:hypothetical protein